MLSLKKEENWKVLNEELNSINELREPHLNL